MLILSYIVLLFHLSVNGLQRSDDQASIVSMMEKGQRHLNELEEKTNLPKYGECWLQALNHLRDGCRTMTDSIQMDLALHFTDCFLDMSGQERMDCVSERTEALKRLCMSEMTDRAFATYTEFFTQTQNMCFFLQGQHWQRETDRTIDRLSLKSREVSEQLEIASEVQQVMLGHQKEGLKLQGRMLEIGSSLVESLNGSKKMLNNLTEGLMNSTKQQQAILAEIFHEFHILHTWLVGRYSFVDRLVFYFCILVGTIVTTSTKRTASARLILILNLIGGIFLEAAVARMMPSLDVVRRDQLNWTIRKLFLASSVVIFAYCSYRYQDLNKKLLDEIKEQNRQIMESILRMKLEQCTRPDPPLARDLVFEEKDSHSTTRSFSTVALSDNNFKRIPRKPPTIVTESEQINYEKENSFNERRSLSRADRNLRALSQASESSVSLNSRYNLRRKTNNYP
ncbi:uncharacterized protein LOC131437383 isoform X2 [Malaya genurostris]|uniref:uncharacterized protein LOC131437383 isoform X2 n=1 Tax=Malaya genurostris TaxID=325434 RepID=UPI0026F3A159|nr:uncharacterized protein LOC131437383 isoform X2 [Malaya genurostris]